MAPTRSGPLLAITLDIRERILYTTVMNETEANPTAKFAHTQKVKYISFIGKKIPVSILTAPTYDAELNTFRYEVSGPKQARITVNESELR